MVAQTAKNLRAVQETQVQSLGQEDTCRGNSKDRGAWWAIVRGIMGCNTTEQLTLQSSFLFIRNTVGWLPWWLRL